MNIDPSNIIVYVCCVRFERVINFPHDGVFSYDMVDAVVGLQKELNVKAFCVTCVLNVRLI